MWRQPCASPKNSGAATQSAHQKEAYERVAYALDAMAAMLLDQLDYWPRVTRWKDWTGSVRQEQMKKRFDGFWKTFIETDELIRRNLLTTASDELNHLRYFFRTARKVFEEFDPVGDLNLAEPKEWLPEFTAENTEECLEFVFRTGRFGADQVLSSYVRQYDTFHTIVFWATEQIRFELGVSEERPLRPFAGYSEQVPDYF